ncbi:MAG: metal-dependent hydrolase [candidate division KSB1 bacterium]|nr:metal-dependent hydrolase [candidate division KSB1 bacterium]MDZ7296155.1 metal-dependent hydrolase [candidate division KSB1 bacterium]MDZ7378524.1 metal-dependent hydrolase [candidate division KSB1 bacterium]MDZ7384761.1 metal-dependent hydrolase [candidate division KSB1 bacterium]MDZ7391274.1 metal-dependent hydrolase [candidate division KSB1 bacterium]
MPSPVAHSLVAIALYRRMPSRRCSGARWCLLVVLILVASLPDADFLLGLAIGDANRYHHQMTHSLSFCAGAAVALAALLNRVWPLGLKKWIGLNGILLGAHLGLDALTADTAAPFGQPLLWPFWDGYVHLPVTILLDVRRKGATPEFFPSLLSLHNLKAVTLEVALLVPLAVLAGRRGPDGRSKKTSECLGHRAQAEETYT